MQIIPQPLFPSMVWSTRFDDHATLNAELMKLIHQMQEKNPAGVQNTNVKGWQSPNNLQMLPEFNLINHQAWVNVSPPGASNKIHYHANCHFSGVYYVSLKAPECGSIYFRDPRVASRMMTYPVTQLSEFTAEEIQMKPEEGRLYVFPGWLEHGVEENRSDRDRVSISFNVLATQQR